MENLAQKKTKGKNMQPKNKVVTINYKSKLFDDGVSECKFQNEEEVILFLLPSGMGNPQFRELEKNYYKMNLGGGYQTAEEYMKSEGVSRTSLTQRIKLNKVTTCKAGQYVFIKNK